MDLALKLSMLIVFSLAMVAIGIWCRRSATDVAGFVLAGRAVGPWMTAFAYGTSYFSAVIFVGYAGSNCFLINPSISVYFSSGTTLVCTGIRFLGLSCIVVMLKSP